MNKISKIFFLFLILTVLNFLNIQAQENEKIKIGLLAPISGENYELGETIIKAVRMAMSDINADKIEIIVKDTKTDSSFTLKSAHELKKQGVKLVIGPVFFESSLYLDEIEDMLFLSLTNKTIDLPKNVISTGVNATSQLNTIKKFIEDNEIKKTILLTPNIDYKIEIKKALRESKIKIFKHYIYDTEPTKLTPVLITLFGKFSVLFVSDKKVILCNSFK